MGRPINKKYFGNRNTGSASTTNDNGIGGQGVASAAITVAGSYTTRPTFTFTAPTLPTGVTATGTINSEALSGVATTAGTGYNVGDLLTLTAADGGTATAYVATLVGGAGTGIATVNFTGTSAVRGTFQALPGAKFATGATAPNTVAKTGAGTGAEITVTFRAITGTSGVTITDSGSGYTAAPTIAGYTNQGGVTVSTIVLATDSGNVGSDTNDENAIIAYAWVAGQREIVDIVKQSGSRRYTVKGADGTVYRAKLTAADSAADGEMDLTATDVNSNTYYVTKLTERRAKLTRKVGGSNYVYADDESAPWSFDAASGIYVQIANA